jgi:hypothetical protein
LITLYFSLIPTYTKSWLPSINTLIDFPEDGRLGQSMLKDMNLKTIDKGINSFPLLFKALLHGQKDCVFSADI